MNLFANTLVSIVFLWTRTSGTEVTYHFANKAFKLHTLRLSFLSKVQVTRFAQGRCSISPPPFGREQRPTGPLASLKAILLWVTYEQ